MKRCEQTQASAAEDYHGYIVHLSQGGFDWGKWREACFQRFGEKNNWESRVNAREAAFVFIFILDQLNQHGFAS